MNHDPKRRLMISAIGAAIVTTACGGGNNPSVANPASVNNQSSQNRSLFTVTSPTAGANVNATFNVTGSAGSTWANVAVWDQATGTKVGADATPSGGTFTSAVNLGSLTGTRQLKVTAFSVAAGQSGGTSNTVNVSVTVTAVETLLFYGIGGHIQQGYGGSYASQLADVKALNATIYRNDVSSASAATQLATAAATISAAGTGVTIYPCLTPSPSAAANETAAYNTAFTLGQQVATANKYPYYEVGNEYDGLAILGSSYSGLSNTDYSNATFQLCRGSIRGMIAGIKSVDTTGKIILSASSWLHIAFNQMLAAGSQPDGTTGHPIVSWDITAWHWYSDFGDMTNANGVNVLSTIQSTFGKPIWLTEIGVRPGPTDAQVGSALTAMLAQYQSLATTYGIQNVNIYELYDGPAGGGDTYGLIDHDYVTKKVDFATVANWIAAHPMP